MDVLKFGVNLYNNLSPADFTIIAGFLATGLHALLKQYKSFERLTNWLLALVFPFLSTIALIAISSPSQLKAYPWVVIAAQTVYQVIEWIKRNAVKKEAPVTTQTF